jgi:glycosyltransferase involved in cell wall biosynthesis
MKTLIFIGSNSVHCQRYLQQLIARQQFKLVVITNQLMPNLTQIEQYIINFSLKNWCAAKQLINLLRQFNPEIVHIHQANSYAWHSLRAIKHLTPRPKVILTTWGSDVLLLPQQNKLMASLVKFNLQNSDIITCDALFIAPRIRQLLAKVQRPIHCINFGVQNLPQLATNLANKQKFILSNRLHKPLYQIDKIIHAFAQLITTKRIDPEYRLIIVADGELNPQLRDLTQQLGISQSVEFTGLIAYEDLIKYYQQAQLFVSIPLSDGTASSLLEAMAYGCIPIVSNLPANLEWVLDQINGFIALNLDQLADYLVAGIELANQAICYQRLIEFNHQLIHQKAHPQHNFNKFLQLYE